MRNHSAAPVCDKTITQAGNWKKHERIHTMEAIQLLKCEKKFSDLSNLKTHERIHTDEKPYSRSKCHNKFTTSSALKTHERIHTN